MHIRVSDAEGNDIIGIPCEEDNTVLISSLQSIFAGSIGLKYINSQNTFYLGVRCSDGKLFPPEGVWGSIVYLAVYNKGIL